MGYIYLAVAIIFEVVGTTALQASNGFTRLGPSVVVVACYGLTIYLFALVLKTVPMGVAYAIWAGLGIVLVALSGLVIYKQALDAAAMIGVGLIISGVVVIHLFSKTLTR